MTVTFQPDEGTAARRIALFPGAFNPPTVAHLEICRAARAWADRIIWVLPKAFPHKKLEGISFDNRLSMLRAIASDEPGFSVALSDEGLYFEIAREARQRFGPIPEIALLCGRDAAERIARWDYGRPGVFEEMVAEYPLLVAARSGAYPVPSHHAGRIIPLPLDPSFDEVSSTAVRERIAAAHDWRHLVPDCIRDAVAGSFSKPESAAG